MAAAGNTATKPRFRRRWLQFSLSTLLLATAGFALWLGLWVDRANRQQRAVESVLTTPGQGFFYEHEIDSSGNSIPGAELPGPAWLRRLIGEKYFLNVREAIINDATEANLRMLDDLPRLRVLCVNGSRMSDDGLACLGGLSSLEVLCLYEVTDAAMAHLSIPPNVEELRISGAPISDAGIMQLAGSKRLRRLVLSWTHVTAEGAGRLKKALPNLEIEGQLPSAPDEKTAVAELIRMGAVFTADTDGTVATVDFRGPQFTDASLEVLEQLAHLKKLTLSLTQCTTEGVRKLQERWPKLNVDSSLFAPVPEEAEAVAALKRFGATLLADTDGRVISLTLFNPDITDEDLVHLRAFERIAYVAIGAPRVTDAGLEHLAGLTYVHSLRIERSQVTFRALAKLTALPNLIRLSVGPAGMKDEDLAILRDCKSLEELVLYRAQVTGAGFVHLAELPKLRELRIDLCPVTDENLAGLNDCKSLESLDLRRTSVTGAGFVHLAGLPNLRKLWIDLCPVTDENLARLKDCKALEVLSIRHTEVTDAGLAHLEAIATLKTATVSGSRVSKEGEDRVKRRFPNKSR